jgi:hypothetical protein
MAVEKELNLDASSHTTYVSDEQRRIRSENAINRWKDPVFREKTVQAISQSIKDKWKDPEYREKSSKASSKRMLARWQDPKYKERLSVTHKLRWQDSEYRAKRLSRGINQINKDLWEAARESDIIPQILNQGLINPEELLTLERGFSTKRPKKIISEELMDRFSVAVAKVA